MKAGVFVKSPTGGWYVAVAGPTLQAGEEIQLTPPLHLSISQRSEETLTEAEIPERKEEEEPKPEEEKPASGRRRQRLTPEQMKELQERMANMSEEERAEMRQRRQRRQPQQPQN